MEATIEIINAKIAYPYDFRFTCMRSLSSVSTDPLGFARRGLCENLAKRQVRLIAKCTFGLRLRVNRRRLKPFFGVGRGHQCFKCVFMAAADKAWSQPLS